MKVSCDSGGISRGEKEARDESGITDIYVSQRHTNQDDRDIKKPWREQ